MMNSLELHNKISQHKIIENIHDKTYYKFKFRWYIHHLKIYLCPEMK